MTVTDFDRFAAKMRAEDLPEIAIDTFRWYWERLREGSTGLLPEAACQSSTR